MTTHSFMVEKLENPKLGKILNFVNRDEKTLAACYEKVFQHSLSETSSYCFKYTSCGGYLCHSCEIL